MTLCSYYEWVLVGGMTRALRLYISVVCPILITGAEYQLTRLTLQHKGATVETHPRNSVSISFNTIILVGLTDVFGTRD